ncbi:MAG: hypothetical protein HYR91_11790 [Flavobacteriia bacterium]|nr:hypothetical protein [Flavobacteriia bacterium]
MRIIMFSFGLFLLFSCTAEYKLNPIDHSSFFHDSNSKVWLIDEINRDHKNYASLERKNRDILIFYKTNKVLLTKIDKIATKENYQGIFYLNEEKKEIFIKFKKNQWRYKFNIKSNDKLVFKPLKGIKNQFELVLIPLPEF